MKIRDLVNKGIGKLKENYIEHKLMNFPKIEEDNEGIAYWDSPKHVEVFFKGITVKEGYDKTVKKFKRFRVLHLVSITIKGDKVAIDYP